MYKIQIDNYSLCITNQTKKETENQLFIGDPDQISWKKMNTIFQTYLPESTITILCFHPEKVFKKLFKKHKYIEAAGGLVLFGKELLFIKRNGFWDLPKGKLEKGESIEMCAVREVEEECGLKNVEIIQFLTNTYHTYEMNEKKYLKQSFWFEMVVNEQQNLVPQTEEEITEVKWFKKSQLSTVKRNTFASILDVLEKM